MVNAYDAVYSSASGCANGGLGVAGTQHFGGYVNRDADSNYYLMDTNGYAWSRSYAWSAATMGINTWVEQE